MPVRRSKDNGRFRVMYGMANERLNAGHLPDVPTEGDIPDGDYRCSNPNLYFVGQILRITVYEGGQHIGFRIRKGGVLIRIPDAVERHGR